MDILNKQSMKIQQVIRGRTWKKDRQYNDQLRKDKRTNMDFQSTKQKTK